MIAIYCSGYALRSFLVVSALWLRHSSPLRTATLQDDKSHSFRVAFVFVYMLH